MLDSFTFVENEKLARAIDDYEDIQINRIINKWIANAAKERYQKSWFRVREYTIDQALDFIIKRTTDSWG